LADKAVAGFTVNEERIAAAVRRNQSLVTALAPKIGYDRSAAIVKESVATGKSIEEIALAEPGLNSDEVRRLLDPGRMTEPGFTA
jgi:fumarate hydratase class II